MIVTARQLEDLHRRSGGNGRVVLPYRARLTPLAHDWLRQRKVQVGYGDVATEQRASAAGPSTGQTAVPRLAAVSQAGAGTFTWWCDGPCGPAKAAIAGLSREAPLAELAVGQDERRLVPAVKSVAADVAARRAAGAVLLVKSAAPATVLANRCPSLRAIAGTCLDAVEQGVAQVAANVLIVEHPYKTLAEVRNLVAKFVRAARPPTDAVERQLRELGACG